VEGLEGWKEGIGKLATMTWDLGNFLLVKTTNCYSSLACDQPTYDRLMDSSVVLTGPSPSLWIHDNNLNLNFVSCGLQILRRILHRLLATLDSCMLTNFCAIPANDAWYIM